MRLAFAAAPAAAPHGRRGRLGVRLCAAALLAAQLLQSALATPSEAARKAPVDCVDILLRQLGWEIGNAAVSAPVIQRGKPCTRASLAQARAAGDLQLTLPASWNAQQRAATLVALLDDTATQCAYAFELGAATRRAATRLQDNPGYRFSALQLGWIGFGWRGAASQGWSGFRSFGAAINRAAAMRRRWMRSTAARCVPNAGWDGRWPNWPRSANCMAMRDSIRCSAPASCRSAPF